MDPIAMLTAIGDATAAVAKEIKARSDLNNSPAMQGALIVHRMQEAIDEQRKEINDEDLEAIQKLLADPNADAGGGG